MKPVRRDEILDYETYEEERHDIRGRAMAAKQSRRVHVGDDLTFLFENHDTVRYQILEMVRVERLVKEADIQHEIDTYNELLGGPGELGCTLLIEIDDPAERDVKLREWLGLPQRAYVELEGGDRVYATFDARQSDSDRLSSVQFLKFDTGGRAPVAVGVELDNLKARALLTAEQKQSLAADLAAV